MTAPIQYDPLMKKTIRDRLYALLFTPADNQMREKIDDIIMKNAVKVHASHASFMYKAVNYSCDQDRVLPRPRNQLDPSLEGAMQEYLVEKEDLAQEKPLVLAFLTHVLNTSDYPGDWNKLLIPALHGPVNDLMKEYAFHPAYYKRIDDTFAEAFLANNKAAISRMKQRLVTNLITS